MLEIKKVSTESPEYAEIKENNFFRNPVYSSAKAPAFRFMQP